eukprot:4994694-Ditylum_brightwellii.AAC.1
MAPAAILLSPPVCPVISGSGNIECSPCSIAREMVVRLRVVRSFVAPMKSSTNTSKSVLFGVDVGGGL